MVHILKQLLDCDSMEKKVYHPYLLALEEEILKMVSLPNIEEQTSIKQFPQINKSAIQKTIELAETKLRDFLSYYNIGFINKFYISGNGKVHATIGNLIHYHDCFGMHKISSKKNYDEKIKRLESLGITLRQRNNLYYILQTNENIDILNHLLKEIGAYGITYVIQRGSITQTKFTANVEDLLNIGTVEDKFSYHTNAVTLNPDEFCFIKKLAKDLITFTKDRKTADVQLSKTLDFLIVSDFANLCKTLSCETTLSSTYEAMYKTAKKIDMENKVAEENLPLGSVQEIVDLEKKMEAFIEEHFSFTMMSIEIGSHYGKIQCKYNPLPFNYENTKMLSETKLKEKFVCCGDCKENEQLFICDLDSNKHIIETEIYEKFGTALSIGTWLSEKRYISEISHMTLSEFRLDLDNLSEVIKTLESYEIREDKTDEL